MKKTNLLTSLLLPAWLMILLLAPGACKGKKETGKDQPSAYPAVITSADLADQLRDAALNGDPDKVKKLVNDGLDVNIRGEGGRTALMMASFNGHTDIVKFLLHKGAKVNLVDEMGRPALIYAASGPFPETVKVLLDHKADPDIIAKGDGWTALMFAAAEGQLEVVKVLLDYGADPSIKEKDGDTAESFARQKNHPEVAEFIRQYVSDKK